MAQTWLLTLIEGVIYGLVFSVIYKGIPGSGALKGLSYGFLLWVVGTLPGMAITYLTMRVPDPIIASWTFGDERI